MAWGAKGDTFVEDTVKRLLNNDPKLTALHILSFRNLGQSDFVKLAHALSANTSLIEFNASGHVLEPSTLQQFADALVINRSLRSLCLGNKTLSNAGLAVLEKGLTLSHLLVFDLELKGLSLPGMVCLSRVLHSHAFLKDLRLARTEICDDSIVSLAGALVHAVVEVLDLRDNQIGAAGALALRYTHRFACPSSCILTTPIPPPFPAVCSAAPIVA